MDRTNTLDQSLHEQLLKGIVIPAMPLAQDESGKYDPRYQRALARYYIDSGAGGIAVGVHTTQFEIRDPEHILFNRVLTDCSEAIDDWSDGAQGRIKIAGITGKTGRALEEAQTAKSAGYHIGLLSLAAFPDASDDVLIEHCQRIGEVLPVMGFYLQPAVGGRLLPYDFWKRFVQIPNVVGIKISPFNRYQTIDVVRAVVSAGRDKSVALYTGNDDNIVADLLTPFDFEGPDGRMKRVRFVGGLLGHWAVWTSKAVELHREIQTTSGLDAEALERLLAKGATITDMNAALFDVDNNFAGCIPGIHEVLRRQGLRQSTVTLNPLEHLSPGQAEQIDRTCAAYPDLTDDDFVSNNIHRWLDN